MSEIGDQRDLEFRNHGASSGELWFVTTHGNAQGFLSSGMVFPYGNEIPDWAHRKFYRDLSQGMPDHVLLLPGGISSEALSTFFLDSEVGQFPVGMGISAEFIRSAAGLVQNQSAGIGELGWEHVARLIHGVIPTAAVSKLRFRTEMEKKQFLAQAMDNFDPDSWISRADVRPGFFDETWLPIGEVVGELQQFAAPDGRLRPVSSVRSGDADRLGGAVMTVAKSVESRRDLPLGMLADLINNLTSLDPGVPASLKATNLLRVAQELLLSEGVKPAKDEACEDSEVQLFSCALRKFATVRQADFVTTAFLTDVLNDCALLPDSAARQALEYELAVQMDESQGLERPGDTTDLVRAVIGAIRFAKTKSTDPAEDLVKDSPHYCVPFSLLVGAHIGRARLSLASLPAKEVKDRIDGQIARRVNVLADPRHRILPPAALVECVIKTPDSGPVVALESVGSNLVSERRLDSEFLKQLDQAELVQGLLDIGRKDCLKELEVQRTLLAATGVEILTRLTLNHDHLAEVISQAQTTKDRRALSVVRELLGATDSGLRIRRESDPDGTLDRGHDEALLALKRLQLAERGYEKVMGELVDLRQRLQDLKSAIEGKDAELCQVKEQLEVALSDTRSKELDLHESRTKLGATEAAKLKIGEDLSQARFDLAESKKTLQGVMEELRIARSKQEELEGTRRQVSEKEDRIQKLEEELQTARQEFVEETARLEAAIRSQQVADPSKPKSTKNSSDRTSSTSDPASQAELAAVPKAKPARSRTTGASPNGGRGKEKAPEQSSFSDE